MKKKSRGTADSFLFGKARLECADSDLIPMLNVLLSMGESYSNIVSGDGVASVDIAYISARRAVALCRASGIEVKAVLLSGLPYYFARLLSRPGIIAGLAAALLILPSSTARRSAAYFFRLMSEPPYIPKNHQ